jgi:hypothetical protein
MKEPLNLEQFEFVWFHLNHHFNNIERVRSHLSYGQIISPTQTSHRIIIPSSTSELKQESLFNINELPVLFPMSQNKKWFTIDSADNLIFEHDILKCCFYLLSGKQEYNSTLTDEHNRYLPEASIQHQLGLTTKPLVNYYFQILHQAFSRFLEPFGISLQNKSVFNNFALFLSHDIDRLYFHHPKEMAGRILQLIGLRKKQLTHKQLLNNILKDLFLLLNYKKNDPWNSLQFLHDEAIHMGFRSTFFWLPRTDNRLDARYRFRDKRIIKQVQQLTEAGFEMGLHAPYNSTNNNKLLKSSIDTFTQSFKLIPSGLRYHFLRLQMLQSFRELETLNITYDCSLGYANYPGFRNSYCFPFRPFDHDANKMSNTWEIPLVCMDIGLLHHRDGFDPNTAESVVHDLIHETKKFGGVFSLLWHNCRLDEQVYPGVRNFYHQLLHSLNKQGAEGLTGSHIIERMEATHNNH